MSLPFKYKGKDIRVATSWDDLTVGQAIDIIEWSSTEQRDMIKLASIASGIPTDELMEMKPESVSEVALPVFNMILHDTFNTEDWTCPPSFVLGDKRYSSLTDIGLTKYGCLDIFEKTIANDKTSLIEKIPLIIASITYEGSFAGREQAARNEIAEIANTHVMNLPIKVAYPVATFFLNRRERSLSEVAQQAMDTPTWKKEQVSNRLNRLVRSLKSILLRAATRSSSVKHLT